MKFIVFNDANGLEERRGVCQDEALLLQAHAGQTAYRLAEDDEIKGTTLKRLPNGEIVAAS